MTNYSYYEVLEKIGDEIVSLGSFETYDAAQRVMTPNSTIRYYDSETNAWAYSVTK